MDYVDVLANILSVAGKRNQAETLRLCNQISLQVVPFCSQAAIRVASCETTKRGR